MENEIHYLQENLKSMEEIQGLTDLQLQEADEEKERILAQLQELEKKVGKTRGVCHLCPCAWTLPLGSRPTVASGSIAGSGELDPGEPGRDALWCPRHGGAMVDENERAGMRGVTSDS